MMESLTPKLSIDKSDWIPVKFGDVVFEPKESVKDFTKENIEHVVGLEHIDPENIHLRRSASINDSTTFTKKFSSGDVLFGRRRAYLKKAARAEFSGICSGDITVMRAKEILLPELLPFIVNNEKFFDYAVTHSAGGLSPRVKFKDLANYEFLLPAKDQQAQLAELLWAMDDVLEKEQKALNHARRALLSLVKAKCINIEGEITALSRVIDKLEAGVSVNSENGYVGNLDKGILKTSAVSDGIFNPTEVKKVVAHELERLTTRVKKGTILVSRMNTVELVGANVYIDTEYSNLYLPDRLWQTSISRQDVNTKFLWFILSSPIYRKKISDLCTGTSNSMKNISKSSFLELKITLPNKLDQDDAVTNLEKLEVGVRHIEDKINCSKALKMSLINQVF